jgi:hypothetical protein
MKSSGGRSRHSSRSHLFDILPTEFPDAHQAVDLIDEFLQHGDYDHRFCLKLLAIAKQRTRVSWSLKRLAVLMLEHQILKLDPDNLGEFDFLFAQLNLRQAPGLSEPIARSVLKEGYSTTDRRGFIIEFRRKLERLNHVHRKISGRRTSATALRDFISAARRDCKLSLARYLFTPEEIVDQILRQLRVTEGVKDMDTSNPAGGDAQMQRAINSLPDFEGRILKRLCETANIYWVSETTSSEINSLVEYPLTTVVLAIKLPGSDIEFEIKRAGRRGPNSLNVVYASAGYPVPPSHRLDGGDMLWLLQYEAIAAAKFGGIYRVVHGTEAPIAHYVSRSTIYSVPTGEAEVQTIPFFTEPRFFGKGFREMRVAMKESIAAFRAEGNDLLPDLPSDLGLTVQFLGHVTPAQAILCGTTSFRLDKLALYLSNKGPEAYFREGLGVAYDKQDERRLADELLEEVLGVYSPPKCRYQTYAQYLAAAFRIEANRSRADQIYLSLLQQIARFWGTLLAIRGYSRGESFVARNVGLKSYWEDGQWRVKMIFMDHDALVLPGPGDEKFYARGGIPNMAFDDIYIWGRSNPQHLARSEVGCLQRIYRVKDDTQGQALAMVALKEAYCKTRHEMLTNPRLRSLFHKAFLDRLLDWDLLVGGYFHMNGNKSAARRWKKEMKERLATNGYTNGAFESYMETIEENKVFLERYSFIFDAAGEEITRPGSIATKN